MKKLIKNEIFGSVNSARMHCSWKAGQKLRLLFMYRTWTVAACGEKTCDKKKKKKGENVETETQRSKRQPKHTLNVSLNASFHCPQIIDCPKYPTATVHFHTYSYPEGITSIFYLAELKVTIVLAELEFLDNNHFL